MSRHIQFVDLDTDITGNPDAAELADCIRVWEEDGTLVVCMSADDTDVWSIESSDYAPQRFAVGLVVGGLGSREEAIELAQRLEAGGDVRCADCIRVFGPAIMGHGCASCARDRVK